MKIVTKTYNLNSKLNKKIVLISDIHYYSRKDISKLNKILDKIKHINPNYICITGDILDKGKVRSMNLLIEWLNKLSNISKVIMVLGNHEFYINKRKKIYKLNKDFIDGISKINNLYFLDNKSQVIDNINFIGLTLPIEYYMINKEELNEFKKCISKININPNYYNILLCHSPINLVRDDVISNIDVDLVLCGHTHGGMVPKILRPIFKTGGLISPLGDLLPKKVYGNIKYENKNIIITSGIKVISESHTKLLKNVFASEVVEINLNEN